MPNPIAQHRQSCPSSTCPTLVSRKAASQLPHPQAHTYIWVFLIAGLDLRTHQELTPSPTVSPAGLDLLGPPLPNSQIQYPSFDLWQLQYQASKPLISSTNLSGLILASNCTLIHSPMQHVCTPFVQGPLWPMVPTLGAGTHSHPTYECKLVLHPGKQLELSSPIPCPPIPSLLQLSIT